MPHSLVVIRPRLLPSTPLANLDVPSGDNLQRHVAVRATTVMNLLLRLPRPTCRSHNDNLLSISALYLLDEEGPKGTFQPSCPARLFKPGAASGRGIVRGRPPIVGAAGRALPQPPSDPTCGGSCLRGRPRPRRRGGHSPASTASEWSRIAWGARFSIQLSIRSARLSRAEQKRASLEALRLADEAVTVGASTHRLPGRVGARRTGPIPHPAPFPLRLPCAR